MSRRLKPKPLSGRPTVSVLIPCYNYGHYLPYALNSVLEQPGVDVEVIVIDDASPDGSAAVVEELAAGDTRIRPILHEVNHGHIATYNEGIDAATGDYFVMLSADDLLTPGSLQRAAALFEAEPSVGMVYGHPSSFRDEPPPANLAVRDWTVWPGNEWIARRYRAGTNCTQNPEVVTRLTVQRQIGYYDPKQPHAGDLDMWLRAAALSDVGRVNGPVQAYYRVHDKSMMRTTFAGHMIDLEGRLDTFEQILTVPERRLPGSEALVADARRALAAEALRYARSAYDHGKGDVEPIDEYMAFAARVWPDSRNSRKWRALERCAAADARSLTEGPVAAARRFAERVRHHLWWRRWRWTGV